MVGIELERGFTSVECKEEYVIRCHLSCDSKTMDEFNGSPYRRHKDEEAGISRSGDCSDDEVDDSPFDITSTKNAPIERLKRWRVCFLLLIRLPNRFMHVYFEWSTVGFTCVFGYFYFSLFVVLYFATGFVGIHEKMKLGVTFNLGKLWWLLGNESRAVILLSCGAACGYLRTILE